MRKGLPCRIAFDANCFIDAATEISLSGSAVRQLFTLATSGAVQIWVSRHTMVELETGSGNDGGAAIALAAKASLLPYRPIGAIKDLVGVINDLPGSFNEWRHWSGESKKLRTDLQAGAGIRDLGALYDAIAGNCEVFVTSDRHLCAPNVARRITANWKIAVMTPEDCKAALAAPEV